MLILNCAITLCQHYIPGGTCSAYLWLYTHPSSSWSPGHDRRTDVNTSAMCISLNSTKMWYLYFLLISIISKALWGTVCALSIANSLFNTMLSRWYLYMSLPFYFVLIWPVWTGSKLTALNQSENALQPTQTEQVFHFLTKLLKTGTHKQKLETDLMWRKPALYLDALNEP